MAPPAILVLLIVIALPLGWLASEFSRHRALRIALGIAAIASSMGVAYVVASVVGDLARLNYNTSYGGASKDLVDTTIAEIEDGNIERVMKVLRRLNLDYHPTYENRANYDELVSAAVSEMKGEHDLTGTKWDASPFTRDTWVGHWEDDSGFWIVIHDGIQDLDIVRSGDDMPKMSNVTPSDDLRGLTFSEGDRWRNELTLKNKYEAKHVSREADTGKIRRTDTLHKLIRATPKQRAFTQRKPQD